MLINGEKIFSTQKRSFAQIVCLTWHMTFKYKHLFSCKLKMLYKFAYDITVHIQRWRISDGEQKDSKKSIKAKIISSQIHSNIENSGRIFHLITRIHKPSNEVAMNFYFKNRNFMFSHFLCILNIQYIMPLCVFCSVYILVLWKS